MNKIETTIKVQHLCEGANFGPALTNLGAFFIPSELTRSGVVTFDRHRESNTFCPACGTDWNPVWAWCGTKFDVPAEFSPTGERLELFVPDNAKVLIADGFLIHFCFDRETVHSHKWDENNSFCEDCFEDETV